MTVEEFSNEFDTLVSSYRRFKDLDNKEILDSIEFDEYEKSIFLTRALKELVIELYNGKNPYADSFEKTEEIRRYLATLVKEYRTSTKLEGPIGVTSLSCFFNLPKDLMFITYESVDLADNNLGCLNAKNIPVIPVTLDLLHRIINNPFRGPNKRRVLRLDLGEYTVELISKYNIFSYYMRYLSLPSPIVLVDLPSGVSINNIDKKTECKLSPILHRTILERAVDMAMRTKISGVKDNL